MCSTTCVNKPQLVMAGSMFVGYSLCSLLLTKNPTGTPEDEHGECEVTA